MIVAIDGPSGAGKSSVSDEVAKKINFAHLDTGAMYRAVAYLAHKNNLDLNDGESCGNLAKNADISFKYEDNNPAYINIFVDGEEVSDAIRTDEITKAVTPVCKHSQVRDALVLQQRKIGNTMDYIVDGRDIGTVVFPDAELKIFLTASAEERAARRVLQNEITGHGTTDFDEVLADINRRDYEDSNRDVAPLMAAKDSIVIDSTAMSKDEVIDEIISLIKEKI